jgi:outer membrane protein assembly factor BamB
MDLVTKDKSISFIFTLFIFIFAALFYAPRVHAITPVVSTSSTTTATQPSTMRHLVRTTDETLHAFIQMGTNTTKCSSGGLWWLYSVDSGTSWTCGSQISSDTTNLMYADARADSTDNIYIVYSVATTGRNDAYDTIYRKISYNGSSSWTINSAQTVLNGSGSATAYQYSVLELEGTTRIWLASRYYDGTNYGITSYYSDSLGTAPTWTVSQGTIDTAATSALYHYPTFARFGTNIALIYNIETGSDMAWRYRADADGLTSWNTQATISTSFLVRAATFSAAGDTTGNIYLATNGSSTLFSHYFSSWSTPAAVSTNVVSDQYASVTTDGTSVWVAYGDTAGVTGGTNKRLAYKKGVSPFAAANFDTNPTFVVSYHEIFDKLWLYDASADTYEDETTDAGDTGTADIAHSSSSTVAKDVGDIAYYGKDTTFDSLDWELSTSGTGSGTMVWEYCSAAEVDSSCATWSTLTFTASTQTNLKGNGYGAFTPPTDWVVAKINSESTAYYYIRSRTSVAYTVGPIGTEFFASPPNNWASLALSNAGVYGIWTENSASVTKVRYSTFVTFSSAPYEPTSLGGHITGATTSDTTPSLTFTLSDPGESDTVKYRVQIDDTSNFGSPIVDYTSALAAQGTASFTVGQAAGSGSYTTGSASQTLADGSYYWRVKAIDNNSEESSYTEANSGSIAFVVDVNALPVEWPMAGANAVRTSWTSETLPGDIDAEWVKPIEPYVSQHVQVIGAGGNVYVATAKGLYAFDASSGTESWVYPTELPLGHSPTYSGGVLYVGGLDKKLHAINATSGAGIWTYEATGGFSTSPVVANNKVYAGSRDGWFYAINTSDGSLAWKYQTGNQILQSAAFKAEDDGIPGTSAGTLFFASNDGYAYALNAATGALVWKSDNKLPSNGFYSWWPVIYEDDVIFTRATFGSGHTGEETDYLLCTPPVSPASRPVGCSITSTWTTGAVGTETGDWATGSATLDLNNNSHGITFADYFETFPEYRNEIFYNMVSGDEHEFDIDGDSVTDAAPVGWAGDGGTPSPPIVSGYDGVLYFRTQEVQADLVVRLFPVGK